MRPVEIYTTPICPYCHAAKLLLQKKGVDYTEIDVSRDPGLRARMTQRAMGCRLCRRSLWARRMSAAAMTSTRWRMRASLIRFFAA